MKLQNLLILTLFFSISILTANAQNEHSCGTIEPDNTVNLNRGIQAYSNFCATGTRYIRVNYHFVQDDNGNGNMTATDDGGAGFTTMNGYEYAEFLIEEANLQLSTNPEPLLKTPGESYLPVPEIPFRFVLAGVYFHQSSTARTNNYSDWSWHDANCVNCDTEINIFEQDLPGPNGGPTGIGNTITYNIDLKVKVNTYQWFNAKQLWEVRKYGARTINHEIFHTLNLYHDFNPDQCDDTPTHNDCWNVDATDSDCDNVPQQEVSNNIMSYNAYTPGALTTCQIGRATEKISRVENIDYVYGCDVCPDWCSEEAPAYAFFKTNKTVYPHLWVDQVNMNGEGSFNEDTYEIDICYLGTKNTINQTCLTSPAPYNSGILSGPVTNINLSTLYNFSSNARYKITLTVDNNDCPLQNSTSRIIKINSPPLPDILPACIVNTASRSGNTVFTEVTIHQPGNYNVGVTKVNSLNSFNGLTSLNGLNSNLASDLYLQAGTHILNFDTNNSLQPIGIGIYNIKFQPLEITGFAACTKSYF